MSGQMSPGWGASAAYWSRKSLYAATAALPPMSSAPETRHPSVKVIAPGGAVRKVPTSPSMVPPVHVTAALARTAKLDDPPPEELWSLWASSDALEGPLESVQAASRVTSEATAAVRAVRRDRLNMVSPQVGVHYGRVLARPQHTTCPACTPASIGRRDEKRTSA